MVRAILVSITLMAALPALTACPADGDSMSPREACEAEAAAFCDRFYACFSQEELAAAGFPGSEAACITMREQSQGCAAQTLDNICDGSETFHGAKAVQCIEQMENLACSTLRDPATIDDALPACNLVCAVD